MKRVFERRNETFGELSLSLAGACRECDSTTSTEDTATSWRRSKNEPEIARETFFGLILGAKMSSALLLLASWPSHWLLLGLEHLALHNKHSKGRQSVGSRWESFALLLQRARVHFDLFPRQRDGRSPGELLRPSRVSAYCRREGHNEVKANVVSS